MNPITLITGSVNNALNTLSNVFVKGKELDTQSHMHNNQTLTNMQGQNLTASSGNNTTFVIVVIAIILAVLGLYYYVTTKK